MKEQKVLMHYKAGWKRLHPKAPFQKADYLATGLKQLLDILSSAENVTPGSVECLYVHRIEGDGKVVEVYKHEASSGLTVVDFTDGKRVAKAPPSEQKSVLSEVEHVITETRKADGPTTPAVVKPRVRFRTNGEHYVKAGFLYRAYEPKPRGNVNA